MGGEAADEIAVGIKVSQQLSIAPSEFWRLTPWHLSLRVEGYSKELTAQYRRTLSGAWHAAYLARVEVKNFPPLGKLLAPDEKPRPTQGVNETALKQAFRMHNERVARENGEAR